MTTPSARIITDHALLRYLERVEHVDVARAWAEVRRYSRKPNDHEVLDWLKTYTGLDIEAKRAALVTPKILSAIRAGARSVSHGPARYVINNSVVVTIKVVEWRPMRPCMKKGQARALVREHKPRRLSIYEAEALLEGAE